MQSTEQSERQQMPVTVCVVISRVQFLGLLAQFFSLLFQDVPRSPSEGCHLWHMTLGHLAPEAV